MRRKTHSLIAGGIIFLFSAGLVGFVSAFGPVGEQIEVCRVTKDFDFRQPTQWREQCGAGDYFRSPGDLRARLYLAHNERYFYMGFFITDSFLTFQDDYSMDFQGSDHLRIYLSFPEKEKEEQDLLLYLLPDSKIKAPLLNVTGLTWRRNVFQTFSQIGKGEYFTAIAVDCVAAGLKPGANPLVYMNFQIFDVHKDGVAKNYWFFGEDLSQAKRLLFK